MTYGLRVYNQSGFVQIDENYQNLVVVAKGTFTQEQINNGTPFIFPYQSTAFPMIFYRTHNEAHVLYPYAVFRDRAFFECTGPFDYIVFGLDNPVQDVGTYGLKVFTKTGALAYDSRFEGMRIQEMLYWDSPSYPTQQTWPYTLYYNSWGGRPWFSMYSGLMTVGEESSAGITVRGYGTNRVDVIGMHSTNPEIAKNIYYPGRMHIPLLRTSW